MVPNIIKHVEFVNFRSFYLPPETGPLAAEFFPFEIELSLPSDLFLKLRLKLLDRDLTISDKTIILISVSFLFASFR